MRLKLTLPTLFLLMISIATSCSSDPPVIPNPTYALLRSTLWLEGNAKTEYTYNPDSSIQKITAFGPRAPIETAFSYSNGRLGSIKTDHTTLAFEYNQTGKISRTVKSSEIFTSVQVMEFTYASGGKLTKLEYFIKNEAGMTLQWKNTYSYNTRGELSEVLSETATGTLLHVIEAYSPTMVYQPWAFFDYFTLNVMFPIYNLPAIEAMPKGKLPSRLVRKYKDTNGSWRVDAIYTTDYALFQNKLVKTTAKVEYPDFPEGNSTSQNEFLY